MRPYSNYNFCRVDVALGKQTWTKGGRWEIVQNHGNGHGEELREERTTEVRYLDSPRGDDEGATSTNNKTLRRCKVRYQIRRRRPNAAVVTMTEERTTQLGKSVGKRSRKSVACFQKNSTLPKLSFCPRVTSHPRSLTFTRGN